MEDTRLAEMYVKAGIAIWVQLALLTVIFWGGYNEKRGVMSALIGMGFWLVLYAAGSVIRVCRGCEWLRPDEKDSVRARIYRATETVVRKTGLPMPLVALTDDADINVLTYGFTKKSARILVTKSFMEHVRPTDEELEAVIAHEMGHIATGDFVIATLMHFPIWLADKIRWIACLMRQIVFTVVSCVAEIGCGIIGLVIVVGGLFFVAYMSLVVAMIGVAIFVCLFFLNAFEREREYMADQYSAMVMGSPKPVQSVLAALDQAIRHAKKQIEEQAARAQNGSQATLDVLPSAQDHDRQAVISAALATAPSFGRSLSEGEIVSTHPLAANRIYFLQQPLSRRRFWSNVLEKLEDWAAGHSAAVSSAGANAVAAVPLGLVTGFMIAAALCTIEGSTGAVVGLVALLVAGVCLAIIAHVSSWEPRDAVRRTILAAFVTSCAFLFCGPVIGNSKAVWFPLVFVVALAIYGAAGAIISIASAR